MAFKPLVFGEKLIEGKTKIIYAHPQKEDVVYMLHKDSISAGDGTRMDTLPGKGELTCRTTSNVFYLLEEEGVDTHYIGVVGEATNLVTRCEMIPLEVIMRRIATGHYIMRNPDMEEGTRFDPVLVEFTFKDDELHDPLITEEEIVERGIATEDEIEFMIETARQVFGILEEAWAKQDVTLVDGKIEFGRAVSDGRLLVADVIDNDSWRIWPEGDKDKMLDKQIYRDMPEVTDEGMAEVQRNYAIVAEMTDEFVEEDLQEGV